MKYWLKIVGFGFALFCTIGATAAAQTEPRKNPRQIETPVAPISNPAIVSNSKYPTIENHNEASTERAIETDVKPSISFCVAEGTVNVRGWQRGEVRVMNENGGKIGFKVMRRNEQAKPSWLLIQGFDASSAPARAQDECLRGSIEIEVPYGSSVNKIKNLDATLSIESVAKVVIESVNGSVRLRDVLDETNVSTLAGDISLEDSNGKIFLKSISGAIAAQRLKPRNIDDGFVANSAMGDVLLQNISHSYIDAKSTSGELVSTGGLTRGGNYEFRTTSGGITLAMPADASFRLTAALSEGGNFRCDFPLKTNSNPVNSPTRLISGTFGTGETNINLTTFNGLLRLKKIK